MTATPPNDPTPSGQPSIPAAPGSEPLPKVLHDLVTVVHKLPDAGLSREQIKGALKAHKAKRDQAKANTPPPMG